MKQEEVNRWGKPFSFAHHTQLTAALHALRFRRWKTRQDLQDSQLTFNLHSQLFEALSETD